MTTQRCARQSIVSGAQGGVICLGIVSSHARGLRGLQLLCVLVSVCGSYAGPMERTEAAAAEPLATDPALTLQVESNPRQLTPVAACRVVGGGDTIYLVYAYQNRADQNVEAPIGQFNRFDDPADRGQPRWFPPGRGAFRTVLHPQSGADTWTLGAGSITGDASTSDCQIKTAGPVEYVIIDGERYPVGIDAASVLADSLAPTSRHPAIDGSNKRYAAGERRVS
jgi:hypothetical protein